jgi:hypothetical protein
MNHQKEQLEPNPRWEKILEFQASSTGEESGDLVIFLGHQL